jgi:hypothetical protein
LRTKVDFSTKGPWNCRSLGFARDDKGKGSGSERVVAGPRGFQMWGTCP